MELEHHGAAAEMAVAKLRGVYWNALSSDWRGLPDLADGMEVKWATDPSYGLLIKNEGELRKRCWYTLVVGTLPTLTVVGSVWGATAMQDKYFGRQVRNCWLVPQNSADMKPFGSVM
jgi:hypothetical protein